MHSVDSGSLSRQWKQAGVTTLLLILYTEPVAAQSGSGGSCPSTVPGPLSELADLLHLIQRLGVSLALLIAVVMLIYAGIQYMRGDPDSVQKARSTIRQVVIGLTIVLLAGGIVEVVRDTLCGTGGV